MPTFVQDPTGLKRLMPLRYYLGLAVHHSKSGREVDVFAAVNLLHEDDPRWQTAKHRYSG